MSTETANTSQAEQYHHTQRCKINQTWNLLITRLPFCCADEADEENEKAQTDEEWRDQANKVPAETVPVSLTCSTDAQEGEQDDSDTQSQASAKELGLVFKASFIIKDWRHGDGADTSEGTDEDVDGKHWAFEAFHRNALSGLFILLLHDSQENTRLNAPNLLTLVWSHYSRSWGFGHMKKDCKQARPEESYA